MVMSLKRKHVEEQQEFAINLERYLNYLCIGCHIATLGVQAYRVDYLEESQPETGATHKAVPGTKLLSQSFSFNEGLMAYISLSSIP